MSITSNAYFRASMEYVHDVAAGAFPGAVLAAWLIRRSFSAETPDTLRLLEKATVSLWLILLGSLVLLGATGVFRLGYWQLNIRQGFLEKKKRMVLVKHTAFVLTLVIAVVVMFGLLPA